LSHPRPADAEVTGECGTVLELAGVKKRLIVVGQLERIAWFVWSWLAAFKLTGTVPGDDLDDSRST
jgi:hypothetical protein